MGNSAVMVPPFLLKSLPYRSSRRRFLARGLAGGAGLWLASGCQPRQPAPAARGLAASFFPWHQTALAVAGDRLEVSGVLPAGVGPHDYQLAPRDMRLLRSVRLVVLNGLGLDDWLAKGALAAPEDRRPEIFRAGDLLEDALIPYDFSAQSAAHAAGDRHHHGAHNPHIWLDPDLVARVAEALAERLATLDPADAAGYLERAGVFRDRLHALGRRLESALQPVRDRPFITFHNAFPYLVRRFGLHQVGVVEEAPETASSPRHLIRLLELIRKEKVGVLFTDTDPAPVQARRLAEDLAGEGHTLRLLKLDPLESGLDQPGAYERQMERNGKILVEGLSAND